MEWYWILLIIVGYVLIGIGFALFLRRQEQITSDDDSLTTATGRVVALWPLMVIFLLFGATVVIVDDIIDNIGYRIRERRYMSSSRHSNHMVDTVDPVEIDDVDYR